MRFVSFLIRLFALLGFLIVGGIVTAVIVATSRQPKPPQSMVLEMVLDRGSLSDTARGGLDRLIGGDMPLDDLLDALERARRDPRVKGLVARLGSQGPDPAQVQELREAIARFRESGRFAYVYATDYGNASYLLASSFDEVWMQPLGLFSLTGPAAQTPFARAALDSLGLLPEVEKREQYKTAPDAVMETGMTPANREMMQSLLSDIARQMTEAIAQSRRMTPEAVRALFDRAPMTDREAFDAHLVDHLGYRDEVEARADDKSKGAEIVDIGDYYGLVDGAYETGPAVAVIHAAGSIADGESEDSGHGEAVTPGALVAAIDDAADDDDVRAILFRIDSGGGSVSASESIRRALVKAREKGKKIVVSMGAKAASGGYWIALPADRIVADPATLTGSIGVFAGKVSAAALSQRLGVNWGEIATGKNSAMWSPLHPFSDSERERLKAFTDEIYDAFIARVAEARHLPQGKARELAGGRVWTGAQAAERGLVDDLGGRVRALAVVRELIGEKPDAPIQLVTYPEEPSALQEVLGLVNRNAGVLGAARSLAALPGVRTWLSSLGEASRFARGSAEAHAPIIDIR